MARAETYGDIARLEQLLDEHASIAALDPAKLPAIRAQIWTLIQAAQLDHDLGLDDRPARRRVRRLHPARRRLAVRGQGRPDPRRPARARGRARGRGPGRPGAGHAAGPPGLVRRPGRAAGTARGARPGRGRRRRPVAVDRVEAMARALVEGWKTRRWAADAVAAVSMPSGDSELADAGAGGTGAARSRAASSSPGWPRTTGELDAVLHALDGGHVPAGPSGSPLRGLVNVLPTGRNFYAVDPKAVPVPAGLGDRPAAGRVAAGPLPRGHRRVAGLGRAVGLGHRRHAHRRRRRRRGAGPARGPAGLGRGQPPGHRPGGRSRWPSSAGPGSTWSCGSAGSSATRSRTW